MERITTLKKLGFKHSEEKLIGHDGTEYSSYFVLEQYTKASPLRFSGRFYDVSRDKRKFHDEAILL